MPSTQFIMRRAPKIWSSGGSCGRHPYLLGQHHTASLYAAEVCGRPDIRAQTQSFSISGTLRFVDHGDLRVAFHPLFHVRVIAFVYVKLLHDIIVMQKPVSRQSPEAAPAQDSPPQGSRCPMRPVSRSARLSNVHALGVELGSHCPARGDFAV